MAEPEGLLPTEIFKSESRDDDVHRFMMYVHRTNSWSIDRLFRR